MAEDLVRYERADGIAVITLNRPQRLNALSRAMLAELNAACDRAEADEAVRAIVLSGAGRAFCSGFDLQEQAADPPIGVAAWRGVLEEDFSTIARWWYCPKPTVSAVRGHALAGGFELAMACDMTVAAEDAVFGEPELMFGAGIVVLLLPWLTSAKLAKELILTAEDRLPVERAQSIGLVNKVVPVGAELASAKAMAGRMARMDPELVKQTKLAINRSYEIMGMGSALRMANDVNLAIEGGGTEDKRRFLDIARERGLKEAVAWRDARFARGD